MTPRINRNRSATCRLAGSAVIVISMIAGCARTTPPAPMGDRVPFDAYPQLVVHPSLLDDLVASDPIVEPATRELPLAVRVPVRSISQRMLNLEYRFVFYGPNKEPLTRNPTWHDVSFPARTRRILSANAISLDAVDWELEIRRR